MSVAVGEPTAVEETPERASPETGFAVHLDVFEGPFDLLLSLIARHRLDVTVVALSQVTDEFIAHIRRLGDDWDLGQASEFLVVAATLLDLKASRLLPGPDEGDDEDLALLEARDLLFARLLQYRAFKMAAAALVERVTAVGRRYPRQAGLEPRYVGLLPEVRFDLTPGEFARLAAAALTPRPAPVVSVEHVHVPRVSVREQALVLSDRLRRARTATFRSLVGDCAGVWEVVGRFLAVLELHRDGLVAFEQLTPLGELHVRWVGEPGAAAAATAEPDQPGA